MLNRIMQVLIEALSDSGYIVRIQSSSNGNCAFPGYCFVASTVNIRTHYGAGRYICMLVLTGAHARIVPYQAPTEAREIDICDPTFIEQLEVILGDLIGPEENWSSAVAPLSH